MARVGGEVIGGKELEAALLQLPKATAKNVLKRALIKAAAPAAAAAEAGAPRGATGNLRASITVSAKLKKSQQKDRRPIGVEVYIGATYPPGNHAHLIEFGTATMAPQPFMRPAWEATKDQVLAVISAEIWASLAKSARTLARKAERGTLSKSATRTLSQ